MKIRHLSILGLLVSLAACQEAVQVQEPRPARNVIVFIGDGMGVSTVTAARIFDGQRRGESGEENWLSFEKFPYTAMVKTYNTNQQVPDSAGTATAIHSGVKTRAGVIAVGPEARRRDCAAVAENSLETIGEIAKKRGMDLGIVTTTRVTHATPATLYAHTTERDWESDRYMTYEQVAMGCGDIARQLVDFAPGGGIDIVLGGGAREFVGSSQGGERQTAYDDLVIEWQQLPGKRRVIRAREELDLIAPDERVLGLFADSHMTYMAERDPDTKEPTLPEMTAAAVDYLEQRGKGYYLLVEGGRIDHGHHDGKPGYAMLEMQAFTEAVTVTLEKVNLDETLILVTADHSHVFTLAGYPTRGNDILGHVVGNDDHGEPESEPNLAADGQPYTTVGYANGPGAVATGAPRPMPETGINMVAQALVPLSYVGLDGEVTYSETHGGEDVVLYGIGNGSPCVRGVLEQNRLFDIITAAYGWSEPICDLVPLERD